MGPSTSPREAQPLKSMQWIDGKGRSHLLRLDIVSAARLKDRGYDLLDHERLAKTISDPYAAADFLFALHCSIENDNALDEIEFLTRITDNETRLGEVLEAAIVGLSDFFRRRGDRLRAAVLEKALAATQLGEREIEAKLRSEKTDRAMEAEVARAAAKVDDALDGMIRGERSGSLSASSGSTRAGSPTASS